jgi:hypothetical protein
MHLFIVVAAGLVFRLYGINWDLGFHLHPDERMLTLVADRISFFHNLNPDFFNYGSLPIYLLKGFSQLTDLIFRTNYASYNGMLFVGRLLSLSFDTLTIILVYKLSLKVFEDNKTALFASFFYATAFFPIQNSHFFVVDVFLTFLTTALIYQLLLYIESPQLKTVLIIGIVFAAMLATKFTAIIFSPLVIFFLVIKAPRRLLRALIFIVSFLFFSFLFMPYAFLDFKRFSSDIALQIKMNGNPYIFPYTLQYVDTLPYLYYLKNICLWGLGPVISLLSVIGFLPILKNFRSLFAKKSALSLVLAVFLLYYFSLIGRSAVKFMRYMLPIYPIMAVFAGYGLVKVANKKIVAVFIVAISLLWTISFLNIYSQPHTRIVASDWILKNIPQGATIAVEHWDDRLPTYGGENYNFVEMTLYDVPDNGNKWDILNDKLSHADYVILASNRLYIPLQKLSDCKKFKMCYPRTTKYYQDLFGERLGFKKTAEFTARPRISIIGLEIIDDFADESFTVYDHPKVMIFKKKK